MANVMKSAWDESSELNNETSYPHSILGDDYVINDNDAIDNMNADLDQGLNTPDNDSMEKDINKDMKEKKCNCDQTGAQTGNNGKNSSSDSQDILSQTNKKMTSQNDSTLSSETDGKDIPDITSSYELEDEEEILSTDDDLEDDNDLLDEDSLEIDEDDSLIADEDDIEENDRKENQDR